MKKILLVIWRLWTNLSITKKIGLIFFFLVFIAWFKGYQSGLYDKDDAEYEAGWEPKIKLSKTGGLAGKTFKISNLENRYYSEVKIEVNGTWKSSKYSLIGNDVLYIQYNNLSDEKGFSMPQNIKISDGVIYLESEGVIKTVSFSFD